MSEGKGVILNMLSFYCKDDKSIGVRIVTYGPWSFVNHLQISKSVTDFEKLSKRLWKWKILTLSFKKVTENFILDMYLLYLFVDRTFRTPSSTLPLLHYIIPLPVIRTRDWCLSETPRWKLGVGSIVL